MGLRSALRRLSAPPDELDELRLREFCATHPQATRIAEIREREVVTVVGEVMSLRIVPRAGTTWLEVTVSDGEDRLAAFWTGRSKIPGIDPGRRLILAGRASATGPGGRTRLMNPRYELLG